MLNKPSMADKQVVAQLLFEVDDPDITLDDVKIEAKWYSPYELNWGIEEYGDRQDIVELKNYPSFRFSRILC